MDERIRARDGTMLLVRSYVCLHTYIERKYYTHIGHTAYSTQQTKTTNTKQSNKKNKFKTVKQVSACAYPINNINIAYRMDTK